MYVREETGEEIQTSSRIHTSPTPPSSSSVSNWIGVIDRRESFLLAQTKWVSTHFNGMRTAEVQGCHCFQHKKFSLSKTSKPRQEEHHINNA